MKFTTEALINNNKIYVEQLLEQTGKFMSVELPEMGTIKLVVSPEHRMHCLTQAEGFLKNELRLREKQILEKHCA